jgi:hypothetical protein
LDFGAPLLIFQRSFSLYPEREPLS